MREIKFRIWCNQQEEMFDIKNLRFDNSELWYAEDCQNEVPYYFDNEDCELMQYTGLKDKNGIEIYEGDIINFETFHSFITGGYKEDIFSQGVICFEYGTWIIKSDSDIEHEYSLFETIINDEELEVIGNIYENSEIK